MCCDSCEEGGDCVARVSFTEVKGGRSKEMVRGESGGGEGGRDAPGRGLSADMRNG